MWQWMWWAGPAMAHGMNQTSATFNTGNRAIVNISQRLHQEKCKVSFLHYFTEKKHNYAKLFNLDLIVQIFLNGPNGTT